jgi:hypothetical protein
MELLGPYIYKLKPGLTTRRNYLSNGQEKKTEYYQYGHITVNNNEVRVSTCLDIISGIVTYPIEEQQYFKWGKYIFFTCGDLYLLVNVNKLEISSHHRKTEKRNYEINISSLFELGAVEKFGFIDFTNYFYEDEDGISHKITSQLPEGYLNAQLKGCMIGRKPKYILARLENSGSPSHFDYELWTNYKDIYFEYKTTNTINHHKTIGLQSRKNTKKILKKDSFEFTNLVGKRPGIIRKDDNVHFMIFNFEEINDLELIRKYCNKVYKKYLAK